MVRKANQTKFKFRGTREGMVDEYGEVRSLSGRRLYLQKWPREGKYGEYHAVKPTDTVSMIWMGTEADAIKYSMGRFLLETDKHPEWGAAIRNFAHDEIDITCKESYAQEVAECLRVLMHEGMNQYIRYIDPDSPGIGQDWTAK
jgi:DNA polymerase I-like protein with 3'-5' exonuclease and polymerase domains